MRKVRCKITYGKSNINFVMRKSSFKGDEDIEKGAPKGGLQKFVYFRPKRSGGLLKI